ncbi:hypothetical protein ACWDYH_34280 [Nocardia goodfellowii]|uniref:Uncharacterized protein n=1 Tax=Nocardia goodfellowii TaxID=882446 RepID=A0ABS4QFR5_9NOCA|nr:hypothetical protein [Nocardia goodfellowii]MBP2190552.1 hypothetical protein [Nocardia goodfellowii]
MPHSHESAIAYVITALEAKGTATREDFDVPGIVATSRAIVETWDLGAMDRAMFWNIAASHLKV